MAPARLSMPLDPIYRGSTWRLPVQFLNEDQTPFDLTGTEATAFMERNGLPRASYSVTGSDEGDGLILFHGDETVTAAWTEGRYGIEVRLAVGGDVLSALVGTIPVVMGPADGGAGSVLPGAAQPGGVVGVVIAGTGTVQVVVVDRVVINTGGDSGGAAYDHVQASPSALWVVNHNLGVRPSATVLSPGGVEVKASVTHQSANQLRVSFAQPQVGSVHCV